jgi:mono/diheme cytochrome c family protein
MKIFAILAVAVLAGGGARAADGPYPLKPGAGQEATSGYCNACHTSDYIVMNSMFLSPAAWKAEVAKMCSAFGAPIDDDTAAAITAYLAENYAAAAKP